MVKDGSEPSALCGVDFLVTTLKLSMQLGSCPITYFILYMLNTWLRMELFWLGENSYDCIDLANSRITRLTGKYGQSAHHLTQPCEKLTGPPLLLPDT